MKPRKRIQKGTATENNGIKYTLWLAILLMGITIGLYLNPRSERTTSVQAEAPVYTVPTVNIAEKFDCSCGACDDILAECSCPTALATKRFIEVNRQKGATDAEIVDLVKAAYGHYKG